MQIKKEKSIYTQLSNKYNLPYPVIEVICNSPFKFINEKITDLTSKSLMLAYLGKFKLKKRYETEANRD